MVPATCFLAVALALPNAPTPAKELYSVYGGNCSRSIRLQGSYDTSDAAFAAAEVFRTEKKMLHVSVRAGAHERDHFGNSATECRVYRRNLKCGQWVLRATVATRAEAVARADELRAGSAVGVVGFYAAK